jgi:hypothetical protein
METLPTLAEDMDEQLIAIRKHFTKVEPEMFAKGEVFASLIAQGGNKTKCYQEAFDCTKEQAQVRAGAFFNRKWVQELIRYFKPDEDLLYIGDIEQIRKTAMTIITDTRKDDKIKIEAMKALQPYIKQEQKAQQLQLSLDDASSVGNLIGGLVEGIKQLSSQGKMIDKTGEIIDVKVLE